MGTYFTAASWAVTSGNIVYATDLNNPLSALDTGLTSLIGDIRTGDGLKYGADTGTINTYVVSLDPAATVYEEGLEVWLKPANTNTGPSTLNVNGLGAKSIRRFGLASLEAGDLSANYYAHLKYSGGYFQIVSVAGSPAAAAASSATAAAESAEAALESENAAAASAATINLPTIQAGDADRVLRVNSGETGYTLVDSPAIPIVSGVETTGNIDGLDFEYVSSSSVKLYAGACLDSTRAIGMSFPVTFSKLLTASSPWVAGSGGNCLMVNAAINANEYYTAYALWNATTEGVDFGLLGKGLTVTEYIGTGGSAQASLQPYTKYRRIGIVETDSSGNVCLFTQAKDTVVFGKASQQVITDAVTTTYATVDHTNKFPADFVSEILYGVSDETENGTVYFSDDGTNTLHADGIYNSGWSDTGAYAWSSPTTGYQHWFPYNASRQFKSSTGSMNLLLHGIRLRR